jgi:glycosyltransferase involved in cell wall biosynthesis
MLLRALARLKRHRWHLTCVGSLDRSPATARAILAECGRLGLAGRVTFRGEVDDAALAACYRRADLFVLASFHEGYGMALAEALARGLPVVSTRAGAIPETVPATAGLLVGPGDVRGLSRALDRVLGETTLRALLAAGARRARRTLPSWDSSARGFAAELLLVGEGG